MQPRLRYDCRCTSRRRRMTIRTKSHPQHRAANCQAPPATLIYIIMGVSGCGKSTVGALLAQELKCPFYDADSYHPEANISKMKAGIPLTDDDRWPWLKRLRDILAVHIAKSQPAVMACSALKPAYRQLLCSAADLAHHHHHQQQQQESQQRRQQQQQREPQQQSDPTVTQPAQQATPSVVTASAGQPGQHDMSAGSSPVVFILLNPPRALLQAWLGVRAAAGAHFMPPSLLDSQLQQLEVPDPSELYMCFGSVPSTNHTYSSSAAGVSESSHAAMGVSNVSAAAADREGLLSYPSSRKIVNTILARSNASALV